MATTEKRRCTLCPNDMEGDGILFTNQHHINFLKKARHEFRPQYGVCSECYTNIVRVYDIKLAKAKAILRAKLQASASISNPSSTSSNLRSSQSIVHNSDSVTMRSPQNKTKTATTTSVVRNGSSTTGTVDNTQSSSSISAVLISSQVPSQENPQRQTGKQVRIRLESPLDTQPTTSAAVAARKRAADPWDDVPSPAVLNGSRLPHIQPIPKRRQFVHANRDIMNIYLADTTGG